MTEDTLPSDEELTNIYKTANDELGKARPLTTDRIFKAMRAAILLDRERQKELK